MCLACTTLSITVKSIYYEFQECIYHRLHFNGFMQQRSCLSCPFSLAKVAIMRFYCTKTENDAEISQVHQQYNKTDLYSDYCAKSSFRNIWIFVVHRKTGFTVQELHTEARLCSFGTIAQSTNKLQISGMLSTERHSMEKVPYSPHISMLTCAECKRNI